MISDVTEKIVQEEKLQKRWVAYFDILGFSATVKEAEESKNYFYVLGDYEMVLRIFRDLFKLVAQHVRYTWFSDSFLIYTVGEFEASYPSFLSRATEFMNLCLLNRIPLRGAITYGELYVDEGNNIFFGPTLVDAVKLADNQDWIGLVMSGHAQSRVREIDLKPEHHAFQKVNIPIKPSKPSEINYDECLAYTFFTSEGRFGGPNSSNPLVENLAAMMNSAPECAQLKYCRTIEHINKFSRLPSDRP